MSAAASSSATAKTTTTTAAKAAPAASGPPKCPVATCTEILDMVAMALPKCDFCSRKYCLKHKNPETHGCRDQQKIASKFEASADSTQVRRDKNEHDKNAGDLKARLAAKKAELAKKGKH